MTCQTRGCPDTATTTVDINTASRNLCTWHATAASVWTVLHADDTDTRPHVQRGCALPGCHHHRLIGRAVCEGHAQIGDSQ